MAVGTGVATTMMPVHRWSPRTQAGVHLVSGALAGGGTAWAVARAVKTIEAAPSTPAEGGAEGAAAPPQEVRPLPARKIVAAAAVAGSAVTVALSVGGVKLDRAMEQALLRRNVPLPRVWMGVAAAAFSLGLDALDARFGDREEPTACPGPS